ncbi:MAG TPA: dihydrofolate reductase family protein [Steroidobacteraceae bacterium]|nr:dihydrofolate reductase family protein [Steroidobacteraceae bacterium]
MKPYVICHMCTTIDGKILGERWPKTLNSLELFETTAATFGIHSWVVGTTTMREFADRRVQLRPAAAPVERKDFIADPEAKRFAIGTDAKGVLRYKRSTVNGDHVVLLVSDLVSDDYLAHLRNAGVSYLFCGRDQVNVRTAFRKLGTVLGLRKVLLEGGGTFNGAVLKAGWVDEISHVVVPVVDGGAGVAGFFDIPGKAPAKAAASLRQIEHRKLPGGINWFRYRVIRNTRGK